MFMRLVHHKSGKPVPPILFKIHYDLFLFRSSFQFHMDLEICTSIHTRYFLEDSSLFYEHLQHSLRSANT